MDKKDFLKGMGAGIIVGGAIAMTCAPSCMCGGKKHSNKNGLGKVLKAIGGVMDDMADSMGF